ALYHPTTTLDSARPGIRNDGSDSVPTDIIGIHDYDDEPDRIARRYHADEAFPRLFRRERPGGRLLSLEEKTPTDLPIVLSEFGGIAYSPDPRTWGYTRCQSAGELASRYHALLDVVRHLSVLC